MTLPANIRVNVGVPFPARAVGSAFVVISKANGIWTVSVDYTKLAAAIAIPDPTVKELAIYDTTTKQYNTATIQQIAVVAAALVSSAGLAGAILNTYRTVTAAGDVTIGPTDAIILLEKTAPAATNIILPTSASRAGVPVTVKDYGYNAATNNITFVPNGTETIDGFSPAAAIANGVALIDINGGVKTLSPLTSGGWYVRDTTG